MSTCKRILVVDANLEFRRRLIQALNAEANLSVIAETSDGAEAINIFARRQPDIVILDIILPSIDGVDVLAYLNRLDPRPSILVLSTFASGKMVEFISAQGANYFMPKPCRISAVTRRVRQMLEPVDYPLPQTVQSRNLENALGTLLHKLGVPSSLAGYTFLRAAILAAVEDERRLSNLSRSLYPYVAQKFETSTACVERSVRHAIALAAERWDAALVEEYFGSSISAAKGKPTNSEFIGTLADHLRRTQRELTAAYYGV